MSQYRIWLTKEQLMVPVDALYWDKGKLVAASVEITEHGITFTKYIRINEENLIMRATESVDKNNSPIFAGDIIQYQCTFEVHGTDEKEFAVVEFRGGIPYVNHGRSTLTLDDILLDGSDWEVIGNIYQDKHLLDGLVFKGA